MSIYDDDDDERTRCRVSARAVVNENPPAPRTHLRLATSANVYASSQLARAYDSLFEPLQYEPRSAWLAVLTLASIGMSKNVETPRHLQSFLLFNSTQLLVRVRKT